MFFTSYTALTDVGLQRNNNEDAYLASPKEGLWVVADGMGGHAAGEVASEIVVQTIQRECHLGTLLAQAIQTSHHDILNAANSGVGGIGMGSTVVALKSVGTQYEVCWVGDSRAYVYSPSLEATSKYELRQLTTDHSYVQMLYQSGAISQAELHTHPEKNIITQCLGSIELSEVKVDRIVGEWVPGSLILLCSDGLSDVVSDDRIAHILAQRGQIKRKGELLVAAALEAGGKDNITVALIAPPPAPKRWFQHLGTLFTKA